jgi:hypothetical protein
MYFSPMSQEDRNQPVLDKDDPVAEDLRIEIFRKMSFARKLAELGRMRDLAWSLKAAALRSRHPDWTEPQIQRAVREVFLYATT